MYRTEVSKSFAEGIKQKDIYGQTEYKAITKEQTDILNLHLEVVDQITAIREWWAEKKGTKQ